MRLVRGISVGVSIVALAACSQPPVQVEYRGSQFYGHEHQAPLDGSNQETYSPDSPRFKEGYTRPVEAVKAGEVSSTDLPPPAPAGNPPPATFASNTAPPAVTSAPANATAQRFIFPMAGGKIISHFGTQADGKANDGINISADEGEPIWASAAGTVVYAGNELQGYGNMVIIKHAGGFMTAYAHARNILVKKGDTLKQGALLGYVGSTGGVKTPQLHFVLRNGKTPVDPEQYLASGNTTQAQ